MAWHMGGTSASPTLVQDGNIPVGQYGIPAAARQFVFPQLDTLDGRLTMAVAHADPGAGGGEAGWTQQTVDPGKGRVAMRWYELIPAALTARQQGTISGPLIDVFNGAVSPSSGRSAAGVVYNRSGPLLLPELRARSHTATHVARRDRAGRSAREERRSGLRPELHAGLPMGRLLRSQPRPAVAVARLGSRGSGSPDRAACCRTGQRRWLRSTSRFPDGPPACGGGLSCPRPQGRAARIPVPHAHPERLSPRPRRADRRRQRVV